MNLSGGDSTNTMAPVEITTRKIEIRGARVHNLKNVDVSIPLQKLTVITGVSGSGKSSLAFETLFVEGQRRYIDSFPLSARRFLEKLEKPDADRVDHVPPAIAFRQDAARSFSRRATVGTVTEIDDSLRTLFARVGRTVCPNCEREVRRWSPGDVLQWIHALPSAVRFQIGIALPGDEAESALATLQQAGFGRIVEVENTGERIVVIDRLTTAKTDDRRTLDSLETAWFHGEGGCVVLTPDSVGDSPAGERIRIGGEDWRISRFHEELHCSQCGAEFPSPDARMLSEFSPLGACRTCRGIGIVEQVAWEPFFMTTAGTVANALRAIPTTVAGSKQIDELSDQATKARLPSDKSWNELNESERSQWLSGLPRKKWIGLNSWLARRKDSRHIPGTRSILKALTSTTTCPDCSGRKLRPEAFSVRFPPVNSGAEFDSPDIAAVRSMSAAECSRYFSSWLLQANEVERKIAEPLVIDLTRRIAALEELGLGRLSLDRSMRSLSDGESRCVALVAALGSALQHAIYVFDEPSAGLHLHDARRVLNAIRRLNSKRNTVVIVEHSAEFIADADHLIELGPGAGPAGGNIVFAGTANEYHARQSGTENAEILRRTTAKDRSSAGSIRLTNVSIRPGEDRSVEIPLNALCVVSGVSGAGKSSLVARILLPAVRHWIQSGHHPHDSPNCLLVDPQGMEISTNSPHAIGDVVMVDQIPLSASLRATPVTAVKAFDEIRKLFARTSDAQVKNYGPAHFSFNARDGGRCPKCEGAGVLRIEMQFLADLSVRCPECGGKRFQRDLLDVRYRGLSIDEALNLSIRDAWTFFARQTRILRRLQTLRDVGLEYVPLGQPLATLSGGERQRLKLAIQLAGKQHRRTLFLLETPTAGLHRRDVAVLSECFEKLLDVGHTLVVVDNHPDLISAADWQIDLGIGPDGSPGEIRFAGRPSAMNI